MRNNSESVTIELTNLADNIIARLKLHGIVIHRYDAISTNSVYLKLDHGVCNSIRISDHKGKKHLSYRYNILTCCPHVVKTYDENNYIRYYFPINEVDLLITKILFDRTIKLDKYGLIRYRSYMFLNGYEGSKKRGFWQEAKIV